MHCRATQAYIPLTLQTPRLSKCQLDHKVRGGELGPLGDGGQYGRVGRSDVDEGFKGANMMDEDWGVHGLMAWANRPQKQFQTTRKNY